jgi:dipeptidyl aminopeptidase/acylaminoacyl peptidase
MSAPKIRLDDRSIERLLLARSVEPHPQLLNEIAAMTLNVPQRRAGATTVIGRRSLTLLAAALLLAVLAGALVLAGRLPRPDPEPLEPAANGWIAYTDSGTIRLVDTDGSAQIIAGTGGTLKCPRFAPDGSRLAYREMQYIRIVELDETGASNVIQSISADSEAPCAEWSPDGQALAFVNRDDVVVASLTGSRMTLDVPTTALLAWTNDGSAILAFGGRQLAVVPLDGREPHTILQIDWDGEPSEQFQAMAASPASPYVAVAGAWWDEDWASDGTGTGRVESGFVRVIGFDGALVFEEQIEGPPFLVHSLAWSPDGTRLAWTDGEQIRVRSLDSATSRPIRFGREAVEGARGPVAVDGYQGLTWSPDEKWLLCEVSYTARPLHEHAIVSVATDGSGDVIVHSDWRSEVELLDSRDLTWQRR